LFGIKSQTAEAYAITIFQDRSTTFLLSEMAGGGAHVCEQLGALRWAKEHSQMADGGSHKIELVIPVSYAPVR